MPDDATHVLRGRLVELLQDTSFDYPDVMLALLAALQATVTMARGEPSEEWPAPRPRGERLQWGREQAAGR